MVMIWVSAGHASRVAVTVASVGPYVLYTIVDGSCGKEGEKNESLAKD
jgi:hypothetical protein